jgi:hypothetical protein
MTDNFSKKIAKRFPDDNLLDIECAKIFSKLNVRAIRYYLESDPFTWSLVENEAYKNWVEKLMQQKIS